MNLPISSVIRSVGSFYGLLIFVYVLMSWFPARGIIYDVYRVIGSLVEPYLGLFRRVIPPMGNIDLSPIIAYFVLQLLVGVLASLF